MKMKRPWKATKMVKMNARAKSSSTSITKTPMIQVMPITTVREMEAFNQFLYNRNYNLFKFNLTSVAIISYSLPNLLGFFFVLLSSVLVFILDDQGHYKETDVSQ